MIQASHIHLSKHPHFLPSIVDLTPYRVVVASRPCLRPNGRRQSYAFQNAKACTTSKSSLRRHPEADQSFYALSCKHPCRLSCGMVIGRLKCISSVALLTRGWYIYTALGMACNCHSTRMHADGQDLGTTRRSCRSCSPSRLAL